MKIFAKNLKKKTKKKTVLILILNFKSSEKLEQSMDAVTICFSPQTSRFTPVTASARILWSGHRTEVNALCDASYDAWTYPSAVSTSKWGRQELAKIRASVRPRSSVDNVLYAHFASTLRLSHPASHCLASSVFLNLNHQSQPAHWPCSFKLSL